MIIEINNRDCQWQYFHSPTNHTSIDWQFLTMMELGKRLLCVSMDIIYGSLPGQYALSKFSCTLFDLSKISRNIFSPQNIREINENKVSFTLNNQECEIDPQETWHDPVLVAAQINPIIYNTGYQFEFWDLSPDIYIVFLSKKEKTKLINDGNWW